ncbi:uncharacterized protein LOC114786556 [Denticeps clupeoides]|uniref:uncharacterized protein LOC114786556 n=1 Tax=Denticeps clupeoides TaxID=299321 RepID=UPI0010A3C9F7|nr:uncharacterized protein LOC114786556 [Denticeps clupeoides]
MGPQVLLHIFVLKCSLSVVADQGVLWARTGDHFDLKCSTDHFNMDKMFMYQYFDDNQKQILILTREFNVSPMMGYEKKVEVQGTFNQLTITLTNLTLSDTGVYRCQYLNKSKQMESREGSMLVVINGAEGTCPAGTENVKIQTSKIMTLFVINACSVILLIIILLFSMSGVSGRKKNISCQPSSDVYESMRPQLRAEDSSGTWINPAYQTSNHPFYFDH